MSVHKVIAKVNAEEAAKEAFRTEIKVRRVYCNITQKKLGHEIGVSSPVMSELLSDPDKISAGRLRKIVSVLKPDPVVVLSMLGYTSKDIQSISKQGG